MIHHPSLSSLLFTSLAILPALVAFNLDIIINAAHKGCQALYGLMAGQFTKPITSISPLMGGQVRCRRSVHVISIGWGMGVEMVPVVVVVELRGKRR